MTYRKKLIEVALPLEAINLESAREKSIRHGHPSTLHLWWSRKPTATARAVLWASLVDDPSSWPDKFPTEEDQRRERQRLFDILGRIEIQRDKNGNPREKVRGLVSWDDVNDPSSGVLEAAQREIARCLAWERGEEPPTKPDAVRDYIAKYAPPVYDPFAGGGSIPLEAQRLGLEAHASDLNPVAVLINKALIEIPPKFKDQPPVNPDMRGERGEDGGESHALPGASCVAKGDGGSTGSLSSSPETTEGRNLRDEIADHTGDCLNSGEYSRGVAKGVEEGAGTVFGDRSGICSGDRNTDHAMRTNRLVSFGGDASSKEQTRRSESNSNNNAPQSTVRLANTTLSSLLFPLPYKGAQGLAADVRYYGAWMRDRAFERIGHLYPKVRVNHGGTEGTEATVIAWLWARTVKCPNPACGCQMPLVSKFSLSTKKGKEAWVEPMVEERKEKREESTESLTPQIRFVVKSGQGKAPEGTVDRKGARCIACGTPVPLEYVRQEGRAGRMRQQLMAIVAEGQNGRVYLPPTPEQEAIANSAQPQWKPDTDLPKEALGFRVQNYGMTKHADLFTPRQLVALTTFSDLVGEARERAIQDALAAGLPDDDVPLAEGGTGARAYGEAIATYLAFAVDKASDYWSGLCSWHSSGEKMRNTFGRQAIPMVWDYAECCPFSESTGNWIACIDWVWKVVEKSSNSENGHATQHDATAPLPHDTTPKLISTDPPYCLAPDTLIQTAKGYVPIQDIQIGDRVLTHEGRFSPVINTSKRWYEGEIYHLTIAGINHPLIITGEHPIYGIKTNPCGYHFSYCHPNCSYMKSQGRCRHQAFANYHLDWIPASEVQAYDLIFMPTLTTSKLQPLINLQEHLPASDYLEWDGLLHYQKATTHSLHRREQRTATLCRDRQYTIPTHLEVTPDLCRLIGFFIAEGYARLESDGGTIQFTLHWQEQDLKDDIIHLMQTCFHLSPGKTTDNRKNNNNSFRLNFYSKPITALFRNWFYTEDGHKCLPQWILELPTEFLEQLIKGYWWGDGYRANNGYKAVTVSPALAGQISMILQKLNIRSCLHTRTVKTTIVNDNPVIARYPQHNIIVNGSSLLKLASYIGEPKNEPLSINRFSQHGYWWENGYLVPIRKIEKKPYAGYVYNLETLDHSYTTAMGCVHNCDNIGYADLSDFFYVWLRRSLGGIYPNIFSTLLVPKAQELVSTPYRFEGSKQKAKDFFESGIRKAFSRMRGVTHAAYPVTIFYAFKQQEEEGEKGEEVIASTGWETMLEGLIQSGFSIDGTWPMRSELSNRMVASGTNALASSIVLVCRPRPADAPKVTRKQFLSELKRELPRALHTLQQGNIAPVDFAQASIGPGMAVFSRYAAVLENDGTPLRVRTALQLINQYLDEYLTEQEGEFDRDTRWALTWFEQHQFEPGQYGDAETLSKAKNTSVQGMVEAGILEAKGGKVRLLRREEIAERAERKENRGTRSELSPSLLPSPHWLITQVLIHALDRQGETGAAALLAKLGDQGDIARDLAYGLSVV